MEEEPNWAILRDSTLGRLDLTRLIAPLVISVGAFGVALFLIVVYASLLFAERMRFARKLTIALGGSEQGKQAMALLDRICPPVAHHSVHGAVLGRRRARAALDGSRLQSQPSRRADGLGILGPLWGMPGAILAVPLTASLAIVLAEVDGTRPAAVMLSARGVV